MVRDFRTYLEQVNATAQWHKTPVAQRTTIQQWAARSHGLLTPGNVTSVVGAILAFVGLFFVWQNEKLLLGLVLVAVGRLGDVLDGRLARATKTSSPFGEGLDAALDKLIILVACLALAHQIVPWPIVGFLLVQQGATAALVIYARRRNVLLHPSWLGKQSAFGVWAALVIFIAAAWCGHDSATGRALYDSALALMLVAGSACVLALQRYAQTVRASLQA